MREKVRVYFLMSGIYSADSSEKKVYIFISFSNFWSHLIYEFYEFVWMMSGMELEQCLEDMC